MKAFIVASLILIGVGPVNAQGKITLRELRQKLDSWQSCIYDTPRQLIRFHYRIERIEQGTMREFQGIYAVDSLERWALRIWEVGESPLSAQYPANISSPPRDIGPRSLIYADDCFWSSEGNNPLELHRQRFPPVSAFLPTNIAPGKSVADEVGTEWGWVGIRSFTRPLTVSFLDLGFRRHEKTYLVSRPSEDELKISHRSPRDASDQKFVRKSSALFREGRNWPVEVTTESLSTKINCE